ncbi:uncharacterized protein LAJ45_07770 [Morchella importuna]|uniref:uncharacterized protein n=1 Tax=Morchella importuna TaxID=1174673 RepID=UPI001E8DA07F|nr:uncharacterized protein LAJ45_07770 [Morchella importuna]KAH8148317.1 hypothetical protein LAJ45_07770 [Morchella importuna]
MDQTFIARVYPRSRANTSHFSISDLREPRPPIPFNQEQVLLTPQYSSPPRVAIGLTALDVSANHDLRICAYVDRLAEDSFVVHLDSWGSTELLAASATWLDVAADDPHFQVGSFDTIEIQSSEQPEQAISKRIDFERTFADSPPIVLVWLNSVHANKSHNTRVKVYTSDIDKQGFTIHVDTWGDSILYSGGASWIAYPASRAGTFSGVVDIEGEPGLQCNGDVSFPIAFAESPNVLLAVNWIDFACQKEVGFKTFVDCASDKGFKWHFNLSEGSHCYGAGVSYLALV